MLNYKVILLGSMLTLGGCTTLQPVAVECPPLPFPSESRACGQDETNIARSMDEIAGRVLDILEQGDRAIAAAKIREDWEDQQESLQKLNEK